jgi:hypothetical protein
MSEELEPYAACKATSEEEQKIKVTLSRFRANAHPVFKKFRAGSISFADMKEAVKKLEAEANTEIQSVLGPDRHKAFMESLTASPEGF